MKKLLTILTAAVMVLALTLSVSAAQPVSAAQLGATKVTAKAVDEHTVSLSWKKVSGAEKYSVYILKPDASKYVNLGSVAKTTASVGKLKADTRYRFKVVPLDITNGRTTAGKTSAVVSITTKEHVEEGVIMEETAAETAEPEDVISVVATSEMTTAAYDYTTEPYAYTAEPAVAGAAELAGKSFVNDDVIVGGVSSTEYTLMFDFAGGCTFDTNVWYNATKSSDVQTTKGTYTVKSTAAGLTITAVTASGKPQTFVYNKKTQKITTVSETVFGLPKGAVFEIPQYMDD